MHNIITHHTHVFLFLTHHQRFYRTGTSGDNVSYYNVAYDPNFVCVCVYARARVVRVIIIVTTTSATTIPERIVAVLCMVAGAAFFTWGCGKMTRAVTDSSQVLVCE